MELMRETSKGTRAPLRDEWLVRLLIAEGRLSEDLAGSLRRTGVEFAALELVRRGILSKEDLVQVVEKNYGVSFAEPSAFNVEKMAVALVPEALCRKLWVLPLKVSGDSVELLMANPVDVAAQDEIGAVTGRRPVPVFGLADKIMELIGQVYSPDAAVLELLNQLPEDAAVEWVEAEAAEPAADAGADSIRAPVIRLANTILAQAIRMKASDIHIEHEESATVVRYRIDGGLRNIMRIPKHVGEGPLVSRIKIMSNLDVADRRRPQDGRAKLRVGTREIGLRVSTIPTAFGEKVVLRILDQQQAEVRVEALGFRPEILARMIKISESNQGLFLMTGPTGSGKTTTLYSLLHRLKSADINVVTVEDPIEYRLSGINQVQVNEKAGLSFAAVLRSVLRQDPDIVLVGEVRDRETADIAFQAALTGHMVFSTLHTNDAIASINRLLDMGVELYKMAPALAGIVSQRLVRRVCPDCKKEEKPNPVFVGWLEEAGLPARQFKGAGCGRCSFTGLSGRTTVTELLDLSEQEARDRISAGVDAAVFREEALRRGWLSTLQYDILWHLSQGEIPFEEAASLLGSASAPTKAPRAERAARPTAMPLPVPTDSVPAKPKGIVPDLGDRRKERILVVDDTETNRTLVRQILEPQGYEIADAEDGIRAIQKIEQGKPDLVLLDIMMPQMDGLAVLKRLRQDMCLTQLPVMILTAMNEAESQALALELGADDYLSKPFHPKILRARVQALFRRSEYASAGAAAVSH